MEVADGHLNRPVATAAGVLFRPSVDAIDAMLSDLSARHMFLEGDIDKLLDARLELAAAAAAAEPALTLASPRG